MMRNLTIVAWWMLTVWLAGCGAPAHMNVRHEPLPGVSALHRTTSPTDRDREAADREIVLSGHLRLEVTNADSVHGLMITLAREFDGYVLLSRDNTTTIRIPAVGFEDAMTRVQSWGTLLDRTVSGTDVSEEYFDLDVRLRNAEATRARYEELLEHAKSIDEMLRLESELERLSKRMDILKGKLNRLQHRVAYATVSVETVVTEESKPGPVSAVFRGLYSGARWLFVRD